jgi:predicted enzyme related to lactoylglutathione lyase
MSVTEDGSNNSSGTATKVDVRLEVVGHPVSDVDRAKEFYGNLGWRLDADFAFNNGFRVVQFTPPGSAASIQFGTDMTSGAPGSVQNLYLIVSDIDAARESLIGYGAQVSEVFHAAEPGAQFHPDMSGHLGGRAPDSYCSSATSNDPDGNGWLLQESRPDCPGASTLPRHRSGPQATWPARCDGRRPLTASTSSRSVRLMRTGPTGTPPTWWPSRPGRSCPHE